MQLLRGITGPTGSGKSAVAMALAQLTNAEIINCDSVQFYRGFDIGSAKPSSEEQASVPHHLFSVLEPRQQVSAGWFAQQAALVIESIASRGKCPLLVGGTGLYYRALLSGLVRTGADESSAKELLRQKEASLGDELTGTERARLLHRWLAEIDPATASRLQATDSARVRRALVVRLSSGQSLSVLQEQELEPMYRGRSAIFVLLPPRALLYSRIEERVELMFDAGFEAEVRGLIASWSAEVPPFASIGYRQVLELIHGRLDPLAARQSIARDTRRYAKRQYTWWRHQPRRLGWNVEQVTVTDSAWEDPSLLAQRIHQHADLCSGAEDAAPRVILLQAESAPRQEENA